MHQRIKVQPQIFSVFFLTTVILALLFFTVTAIQPLKVAAQNLESNTFDSITQESMSTLAPPSLPFIQASSVATLYLPIIFKSPPVVYFDNFSDEDSHWAHKVDDGKCYSLYDGGRYRLNIDSGQICLRPAPKDSPAERTYGSFEVLAYHSEGQSNSAFGIYINGNGADNQYILKIRPNNSCSQGGDWEFTRNRNGTKIIVRSGHCNLNIRRGYGSANFNLLKVKHTSDRQITLYINGVQIDTFNEAVSQELTGRGTGVYAEASSSTSIVIKYDDFIVFAP